MKEKSRLRQKTATDAIAPLPLFRNLFTYLYARKELILVATDSYHSTSTMTTMVVQSSLGRYLPIRARN